MPLMPVTDALAAVLDGVAPSVEESVELDDALGRVLSRDLAAKRTQPPQAMSAMDGYAVRSDDAVLNAQLKVIGEIAAGRPFERPLRSGEALRIFTGGVIPDGADAVVIQEDTVREGDAVFINEAASPGRHIRPAGVDFHRGDVLLPRGRLLSDRDLALAAAMNYPTLPVTRRPRMALLATGDELVMPGTEPGPGQIVYSNGYALRALARREGAEVWDLGIAGDTMKETASGIRRAINGTFDVLVTIGGASVGDHDLVKRALEAQGVNMGFWQIAMRPGKPMMFGKIGPTRVLGLPGNPVSSYVCATLFLAPLLRAMAGRSDVGNVVEQAVLGRDLNANDHREDYLRATLMPQPTGLPVAMPVSKQDSSLLGNLSVADCLLIRPPHAPAARAGERCMVMRLTK